MKVTPSICDSIGFEQPGCFSRGSARLWLWHGFGGELSIFGGPQSVVMSVVPKKTVVRAGGLCARGGADRTTGLLNLTITTRTCAPVSAIWCRRITSRHAHVVPGTVWHGFSRFCRPQFTPNKQNLTRPIGTACERPELKTPCVQTSGLEDHGSRRSPPGF